MRQHINVSSLTYLIALFMRPQTIKVKIKNYILQRSSYMDVRSKNSNSHFMHIIILPRAEIKKIRTPHLLSQNSERCRDVEMEVTKQVIFYLPTLPTYISRSEKRNRFQGFEVNY